MNTLHMYEELEGLLKSYIQKYDLRDSSKRYKVLRSICMEEDSFTAIDVYLNIALEDHQNGRKKEGVSLRTVYEILNLFRDAAIIEEIPSIGNMSLYKIKTDDN